MKRIIQKFTLYALLKLTCEFRLLSCKNIFMFIISIFFYKQIRYDDDDEDEGPQPDPTLEQGVPVPVRMQGGFPAELASTPLEDIDGFYSNKLVGFFIFFERP